MTLCDVSKSGCKNILTTTFTSIYYIQLIYGDSESLVFECLCVCVRVERIFTMKTAADKTLFCSFKVECLLPFSYC